MLGATLIGLFIIPSLYYVVQSVTEWLSGKLRKKPPEPGTREARDS